MGEAGKLAEVAVQRDNDPAMAGGQTTHPLVLQSSLAKAADVHSIPAPLSLEMLGDFRREIFVQKKFHPEWSGANRVRGGCT